MANEVLVSAVKHIMSLSKSGDLEGSYAAYQALFASPEFATYRPEDQRQALKLMVLAKRSGPVPPKLLEAHRAALAPLTELVSAHSDPADYEMLGLCHLLIGNAQAASNIFREGLGLERAKTPGSDLCGRLMTRLSAI